MIIKKSQSSFGSEVLNKEKVAQVLADPKIVSRMSKVAKSIKTISPKSDDFLYFSIIFMKAAEASTLDEYGNIKKLANGEDAWGYFDSNWKWHGNVKPHRNNNSDIFPESELKVAAKEWIGLPLCRDHESSSVDGIRGIILDTHYDEKFKQIVGLCALDRANYPDLASKVEKGLVRYGSMGTAVETSVCTECGNMAKLASDYCDHVKTRSCHGEINVGLKPIEYSLVVQPAEPGAVLLKCIASLNQYKQDFTRAGVSSIDEKLASLNISQAKHLESIMKTACSDNSCSIEKRNKIIGDFFKNNISSAKRANLDIGDESLNSIDAGEIRNIVESAKVLKELGKGKLAEEILSKLDSGNYKSESESFSYSEPSNFQETVSNPIMDDDSGFELKPQQGRDSISLASTNKNYLKQKTKAALEEYMSGNNLRNRAQARRKIAYMQGGSEGKEPNTFKEEKYTFDNDKHMKQTGSMGGEKGLFPGDAEAKEKLSRAQLQERYLQRLAYMQGGSEGKEPKTFKEEKYTFDNDKHMKQTGSMGGEKGLFPGDSEAKEKLSRASIAKPLSKTSAYRGPSLKTKLKIVRTASGSVDKRNSIFEVYAGDKRVFAERVGRIFGSDTESNWSWVSSKEYGKEVCKTVRAEGLEKTIMILKNAQELPPMEDAPAAEGADAPPPMMDAPEGVPPMEEGGMDMPEEAPEEDMEEKSDPATDIDGKISDIEGLLSDIRDLTQQLKEGEGRDVTVNVNTFGDDKPETSDEITSLARDIIGRLKTAAVELDESADEMAMVSETYENIQRISSADRRRFVRLAKEATADCDRLIAEAKTLLSVGAQVKTAMSSRKPMRKMATGHSVDMDIESYLMSEDMADDMNEDAAMDGLISEAMDLRKSRREAILKQANKKFASYNKAEDKKHDMADDMTEDMVDDMADDMADDMTEKQASFKNVLNAKFEQKKIAQERENYKIKLRRAYDVALEMQRKGLISQTKTALDQQVDNIMGFDDNAFESFKRSIAGTKNVSSVKVASDLGGVNIGLKESNDFTAGQNSARMTAQLLSGMWDK